MTRFPNVQKKAQTGIDTVVGPGRLPSFADCDSLRLPYIDVLVKEVSCWHTASPPGTCLLSYSPNFQYLNARFSPSRHIE